MRTADLAKAGMKG